MNTLPALFLSHGSPMVALEPGATGPFLQTLGPAIDATFARPRAILAVSAHSTAREPVLLGAARQPTVHDFGGFPQALYELNYDAPGEPALARDVEQRLQSASLPVHRLDEGGLDHGIWTMLRYMYPDADVPVLPLAWVTNYTPEQQFALGEVLAPLRSDGVLVLGTGSITHNLKRFFGGKRPPVDAPEAHDSAAFRTWMAERSAARDWDGLLAYRSRAPYAQEMHPTDEHLLPWYVAAGAGGRDNAPVRLHSAITYGSLGMDAYAFGPEAPALAEALAAHAVA